MSATEAIEAIWTSYVVIFSDGSYLGWSEDWSHTKVSDLKHAHRLTREQALQEAEGYAGATIHRFVEWPTTKPRIISSEKVR